MKVTIIVDKMSAKTIEKADGNKMTTVRLSGLDINNKRRYVNYKFGKAMQIDRDINGFVPEGSDINDVSIILVVEGEEELKTGVNQTTGKPYSYYVIEGTDYYLQTGSLNTLTSLRFETAKTKRKIEKLFSDGKYSDAYSVMENFLTKNSYADMDDAPVIKEEDEVKNQEITETQIDIPIPMSQKEIENNQNGNKLSIENIEEPIQEIENKPDSDIKTEEKLESENIVTAKPKKLRFGQKEDVEYDVPEMPEASDPKYNTDDKKESDDIPKPIRVENDIPKPVKVENSLNVPSQNPEKHAENSMYLRRRLAGFRRQIPEIKP